MATILLTRQSRSRGKKRRQTYHAEVCFEQKDSFHHCDHCHKQTKPWTNFHVTVIQNRTNFLFPSLSSDIGSKIRRKISNFLRANSHLCIDCTYHQLERANRILGLRQR